MTNLMELASRVEAGEGPDRELDVLIALSQPDRFFNAGPKYPGGRDRIGEIVGSDRCVPGNGAPDWLVPRYTASVDAAISLVPAGSTWMLDNFDGTPERPCTAVVTTEVLAKTPALALTAACLRARAHQGAAHVDQ